MSHLMIANLFRALAEEAHERATYFYQQYESAYYEASKTELDRIAEEGNDYNYQGHTWSLWANVWLDGWPGSQERSMKTFSLITRKTGPSE